MPRPFAPLAGASVLALTLLASPAFAQSFDAQTIQGRTVKVYTPSKPQARPPVLVLLHGCTQNPDDFAAGTRMNDVAEQLGWIVVYPQQDSSENQNKCWNWYQASDQARGSGEPALIAAIADQVVAQKGGDPDRVYVCGLSAGAAMSCILGATYPDKFAAIGICSGLEYAAATDVSSAYIAMANGGPSAQGQGDAAWQAMGSAARLVPVMIFHGTSDTTVQPVNADQIAQQWARTDDLAPDGKPHNVLGASPSKTSQATSPGGMSYTVSEWQDASGRTVVEQVKVSGMSHAWSGGDSSGSYTEPKGPDASTMLCQFFQQFSQKGYATSSGTTGTTGAGTTSTGTNGSSTGTSTGTPGKTFPRPNLGNAPVLKLPLPKPVASPAGTTASTGTTGSTGTCPTCNVQTLTVHSNAAQEGTVGAYLSLGDGLLGGPQVADTGTYGGELYRAIVSFDVTSLPPSAQIAGVKLRLARKSLIGTVSSVSVDVKEGWFGATADLQKDDYSAAATVPGAATLPVPASDGAWAEVDLPPSTFAAVASGTVQVRLAVAKITGLGGDFLTFHGAADGALGPQLLISYH